VFNPGIHTAVASAVAAAVREGARQRRTGTHG